jgi:hypothetical protein
MPQSPVEREASSQTHRRVSSRAQSNYTEPLPSDDLLFASAVSVAPVEPAVPLVARRLRFRSLNSALYLIVPRIPDSEHGRWMALVEEMALRRTGRDVSLRTCIAPGTLNEAETAYLEHADALEDEAKIDGSAISCTDVDEDFDQPISFETYVQSVLDEEGKMLFLKCLFYGDGVPMDTRELMKVYQAG